MKKQIEKIILNIANKANMNKDDVVKILAGLAIISIVVSWFILGLFLSSDKIRVEQNNDKSYLKY